MARRLPHHHTRRAQQEEEPAAQDTVLRAWIRTTYDALLVFEAARQGIVPRVTRRFHDAEKRSMIVSGAVLVFTEEESGIKRWTDPFMWSASRMLGNFMIYREREEDVAHTASPYSRSAISGSAIDAKLIEDPDLERSLYGSWNRGRGMKSNGLMKKTISFTIDGIVYHLISYYNPLDVLSGELQTPVSLNVLSSVTLSKDILKNISRLRNPPRINVDSAGKVTYLGEEESAAAVYARTSRSPTVVPQDRPGGPSTALSPSFSILQPVPRKVKPPVPDSHSPTSESEPPSIIVDPSCYSQDSRISYIRNSSSDYCVRVPHPSLVSLSSSSFNPYPRPHDPPIKRTRSRQHSGAIVKQQPSSASSSGSNSESSNGRGSSSSHHHMYGPAASTLPHLLGGGPGYFGAAGFAAESESDPDVVASIWNAVGGSADWMYEGAIHPPWS